MQVRIEAMKRCEVVFISGQVDSASAPELEDKLLRTIASGKHNLVVNLREVPFVSSAGLKALIAAQMKARKAIPGGELVLSEVPANLKDTFELVGLHRLFTFYDRDVDAVGSF